MNVAKGIRNVAEEIIRCVILEISARHVLENGVMQRTVRSWRGEVYTIRLTLTSAPGHITRPSLLLLGPRPLSNERPVSSAWQVTLRLVHS